MKVDLLTLYPDNTHDVTRRKLDGERVKVRGFNPKLIVGQAVFPERASGILKRLGLQRKKRLVIWSYGAETCHTLDKHAGKLDDHWNTEEGEKIINKMIAWAAAKAKLFSKVEVIIFWILLGVVIVMNFLILRRIGI